MRQVESATGTTHIGLKEPIHYQCVVVIVTCYFYQENLCKLHYYTVFVSEGRVTPVVIMHVHVVVDPLLCIDTYKVTFTGYS